MIPLVDLKSQYLSIKPEIDAAIGRVLETGAFALGPAVADFEKQFAPYCGVAHAAGVNSGTSALHLALLALGIGRGGLYLDDYLAWEDVDHLVAVPGGSRGSGRLVVVATNGAWREVPVDWLSHTPSAVDNAVRALSGDRHHVDLRPLDN